MENGRRFIADLEAGETLEQSFLVRDSDLRHNPSGSTYLACLLSDRTGTIAARWWKASETEAAALPRQRFARVTGHTTTHKGHVQIIVKSAEPLDEDEVKLDDFLPATAFDIDEMWGELLEHLETISNPHLRRLADAFTGDDVLATRFRRSPAASSMHHAVVGGLLEHTLNVVRLVRAVTPLYGDRLNIDLVLIGAFLHDIGKTEEMSVDTSIGYTDRGNLVGHINTAMVWVQQKADQISRERGEPFPQKIIDLVQHLILSHHGSHEYGSPKRPMIPEAFVLNTLDNLDAKVEMTTRAVASDPDATASFTSYQRGIDGRLFKGSRDLPE